MSHTSPGIPVLDHRDLLSEDPSRRSAFVDALGDALATWGFVAIAHHGLDADLLDAAYRLARQTFALPDSTKRTYEDPVSGRQRGWTPFGLEQAKDASVADLKEFWQVGRDVAPGVTERGLNLPENRFPAEVPGFAPTFSTLFHEMEALAQSLLRAVATYLELPEAFFGELTRGGDSVIRVIHYPPLPADAPAGAVRAAAHEDINLMTVLPASTNPGLELLDHDGRWNPVHTPPGVVVVDTGDMMKWLTNGRLAATRHRVVTPPGQEAVDRLSMPFFVHPRPEVDLSMLRPDTPELKARAFLDERLREIGVLSSAA